MCWQCAYPCSDALVDQEGLELEGLLLSETGWTVRCDGVYVLSLVAAMVLSSYRRRRRRRCGC